ncbi:MAG: hypothetical protein ABIY51_09220, partial [Ferruginibacter sp.]
MKQFIFLFFFLPLFAYAQNIGIGTTSPANKLHVMGNLLVNEPALSTNTAPSALQTKTLVNASTITFTGSDSTGLIYDPGGPAGNYIGNLTSYAVVYSTANCIGFELDFQQMDLAAGDSLIIKESSTSINPTWYAVGNGYNTTGKISISGTQFYSIFKSNNDGINGSGFALLYKTLYRNTQQPVNVSSFSGNSLFYDAKNSAFRVGLNSSAARGDYSFGSGYLVTASGPYSNAIGFNTSASGYASTATGYGSLASAQYSNAMGLQSSATGSVSTAIGDGSSATGSVSTAIGYRALATGNFSTAIGNTTNASGHYSTAIGYQNTASGAYSTAIGYGTLANNSGAAAMGNATTASGINSTAMGTISVASGSYSTAMGYNTSASGAYSTAMGYNTTASGNFSTAIGYHVSTLGYLGSLIIGDASSTTNLNIVSDNSFRARFVNGYGFFTGTNIGVYVQPGGNSWVAFSDVRFKEN